MAHSQAVLELMVTILPQSPKCCSSGQDPPQLPRYYVSSFKGGGGLLRQSPYVEPTGLILRALLLPPPSQVLGLLACGEMETCSVVVFPEPHLTHVHY